MLERDRVRVSVSRRGGVAIGFFGRRGGDVKGV